MQSIYHCCLSYPGEEDLENFRTIPIYPTRDEFHKEERPYLRPNITTRQHANTETYLDTHFRLLREDFVRPLREGIQKLIWSRLDMGMNAEELKRQRFDDISVYFDAKLGMPMCTRSGLAYIVQFDIKPLKVSVSFHMNLMRIIVVVIYFYDVMNKPSFSTVCALGKF